MTKEYPLLLKRIQALLIDSLILIVCMIFIAQIISLLNGVPDGVRMGAFLSIFFLYDPLMTSKFGGTLGHMAIGIRVKKESTEEGNISFLAALSRFAVKSIIGWISLLTVTGNPRKHAIHDLLSGSVVIYKRKAEVDVVDNLNLN